MRSCEEVIITLNISDPACSYDMELPSFMNIGELRKKLLETLRIMDARRFASMADVELTYNGQRLDEKSSLANYGIWDGNCIDAKMHRVKQS